ncbi:MAG: asparaginase, partial [Planctomycetota bacterium]
MGITRRELLAAGTAAALLTRRGLAQVEPPPVSVSSANGLRTVERARARAAAGMRPVEAAVEGVTILEDDPNDMSVGYGGLPNEEG